MSVAVVGGAVIGVAGSMYSASKASSAAKKSAKMAANADQARLDFAKEQYNEWKATYGPIEDSLAAYYNELTPTMRISQGLEAHQKEMDRAMAELNQTLEQRGGGLGGMTEMTKGQFAIASAEERARIRASAPMDVAKEKLGFLQVGLGQDPSQGISDALTTNQSNRNTESRIAARNAGEATGAVIDSVTNLAQVGLDRYAKYRAANPKVT